MTVLCLSGPDHEARDALASALVRGLSGRGATVSVIGRTGDDDPIDTPGKDTHAHAEAGAKAVLAISDDRWAVMRREQVPPTLATLLARLQPAAVVLAVGFDEPPYPTLMIEAGGIELRRPKIVPARRFDLDNPGAIIDFILLPHNPDR